MRRIYLTIIMTVLLLAGGHCAFAKKSKTIEVETAKFEKSDGKQIKLLENTDSPELAKLVKEGIKSFFAGGPDKTMSDEEVLEFLFASEAEELDNIPLPLNNPYLSDTGVVFLYTQYEIAPYSSGIITFEVPFKDITPYLTEEAKALIK